MAETLKEFLVSLGWAGDTIKRDQRHFEGAITAATLKAELIGDLLIEIARKIGDVVKEVATKFDDLYFAAQRANSSAALANDFPLLIKKYGGNPAEAAALLEAAGQKLRENRNNITVLNKLGFGLDATTGKLEIQKEMIENLRNLSVQQIESLTAVVGISAQPILLLKRHLDEVLPDLKAFEDYRKSLGVDIEQSARDGNAFQTVWRSVAAKLQAIADMIGSGLTVAFTPLLTELNKFLTVYAKEIGAAIKIVIDALIEMLKTWAQDFDKVLSSPDSLTEFSKDIREFAENIAYLARKMESLIVWLKAVNVAAGEVALLVVVGVHVEDLCHLIDGGHSSTPLQKRIIFDLIEPEPDLQHQIIFIKFLIRENKTSHNTI